jgi:hypothetical protein
MFQAPLLDVIGGSIPVCVSHCHERWTAGIKNLVNHPYGQWKQIDITRSNGYFIWKQIVCFLEAMLMETNVTLEVVNVSFVSNL